MREANKIMQARHCQSASVQRLLVVNPVFAKL